MTEPRYTLNEVEILGRRAECLRSGDHSTSLMAFMGYAAVMPTPPLDDYSNTCMNCDATITVTYPKLGEP